MQIYFKKTQFNTYLFADAKLAAHAKIPVVIVVREDYDPDGVLLVKKFDKEKKKKKLCTPKSRIEIPNLDSTVTNEVACDVDALTSGCMEEAVSMSTISKVTPEDVETFPIILKLTDLMWKEEYHKKSVI